MTSKQKAADFFNRGYNCSQSVLATYCERYGLDIKTATRLSLPLGSGMNYGEVCGAVAGALLVIGLEYSGDITDNESNGICYEKGKEYLERYKIKMGSYMCKDILGYDFSIQEDRNYILESKLYENICPTAIEKAIELLEEMIITTHDKEL